MTKQEARKALLDGATNTDSEYVTVKREAILTALAEPEPKKKDDDDGGRETIESIS